MDNQEPKARYPRQEVADGQEHGYIGEVEVYDPPEQTGGFSNAETADEKPAKSKSQTTKQTAADAAPEEAPIAGEAGTIKAKNAGSSSNG